MGSSSVHLKLKSKDKASVFAEIDDYLSRLKLSVQSQDARRPWGGFFVLKEEEAEKFVQIFFSDLNISDLYLGDKLSPKILLVEPHRRLSWQYHHRRAEIWRVVSGKVAVVTSNSDAEGNRVELKAGDTIRLSQGQRHRLVGLEGWGVVAEIWQHTDAAHPSNEDDIVRLQDDFGR